MSRSYYHSPFHGITSSKGSKWFKRHRAHRERAKLRELKNIDDIEEADCELAPWNEWDSPRDGVHWYSKHFTDPKARAK